MKRVTMFLIFAIVTLGASAVLAKAKPGRYQVNGDGTVYDTTTKLTWQRTLAGATSNWTDAKTSCASNSAKLPGTGWHLPELRQLQSIVDRTEKESAIDPTAFPSTPYGMFWSSTTTFVASATVAWGVYLSSGISSYDGQSLFHRVRCVR
jgi:hypothetical protein